MSVSVPDHAGPELPRYDLEERNTFVHFSGGPVLRRRSRSVPPEVRDAAPAAPDRSTGPETANGFAAAAEYGPCGAGAHEKPHGCPAGDSSPRGECASDSNTHGVTTLMLRNIPCRCREQEVIEAFTELGLAGGAQFFYMPVNSNILRPKNQGFAFIGFTGARAAETFRQAVDGRRIFVKRQSTKAIAVVPAHVQGLTETMHLLSGKKVTALPSAITNSFARH